MQPYDRRHPDRPLRVVRFRLRGPSRHYRIIRTTMGRRRRWAAQRAAVMALVAHASQVN